jgi:hypothetical protein
MSSVASLRLTGQAKLTAVLVSVLLCTSVAAKAADISGIWWIKDRSETAKLDHDKLPFTPAGAEQYKKNKADIASGKGLEINANNKCLPPGLPRIMLARYPFQILQRPEQITFLHERMHQIRLIYVDKPHPDADLSFNGDSIGKWDGNTFVVDTTLLKDNAVIDKTGIPHSEKLHLVERFATKDGGKTLVDQVTMEDPETFTRPVTFSIEFAKHPEVELMEDICTLGPPPRDALKK